MRETWRNLNILVVGDRSNTAESLSLASGVLNARWAIEAAKDGHAARDSLDLAPCDIVIVDAQLFDQEGFGILQLMREVSKVPIFVLMANRDEMAKVKALELGADCCLDRPFTFIELISRIKGLLLMAERRCHPGSG